VQHLAVFGSCVILNQIFLVSKKASLCLPAEPSQHRTLSLVKYHDSDTVASFHLRVRFAVVLQGERFFSISL